MLQEKYKIFPEICEKVSKIDVFLPKMKVLFQTNYQIMIFMDASANVMSNHNSFTVESCVTKKYKIFPEICEKMSKTDVFTQKIDSHIQQMSKLYFDTNAVTLYVRKVKAVYILILQCKRY